ISLDYDDTIMAAAGQQAEQALADVMREYKGNYIVAVEGNAPLNEDGMFCILAGEPFLEKLKRVSADAKAIIAWGSCASWGCVQAARPNPTYALTSALTIGVIFSLGFGILADKFDKKRYMLLAIIAFACGFI
ncbi:hypothetical protein MJI37_29795, partial [Salmonella enterica subsp. enterica serovar Cerro]|nr:hypothetical protein [Salmonella enterica subsp. enterica serovar Cerro]